MSTCTALSKIKFEIPAEFYESDIRIDGLPSDIPALWQIKISKDIFIYTVSEGNIHHVLTDPGVDFVRDKIVESKL